MLKPESSKNTLNKLSDAKVKNAKPTEKPYKLFDGGGLFLLVKPDGGKMWRMKYRVDGKEKLLSLGVYPDVSLEKARKGRYAAREQLAENKDPSLEKQNERKRVRAENASTFQVVANEWKKKKALIWRPSNTEKITWLLEKNLFPWLGDRPIGAITPAELLSVLRKMEDRGAIETAQRAKQLCGQIFRYAVVESKINSNIVDHLNGSLSKHKTKHHAAITDPKKLAFLLRAMDAYSGSLVVKSALSLSALLFVRPGELRHMEWEEVDLDNAQWNIPESKMKMKRPHLVPLSAQALEILNQLKPLTGRGKYVLPSERGQGRPMSENSVNVALRALGFDKDTQTAHGFRATARTILDEVLEMRVDLIEHQLAHEVKDANGRAYNRTAHLPKRREMMQIWADYLDTIKVENVIPVNFGKTA